MNQFEFLTKGGELNIKIVNYTVKTLKMMFRDLPKIPFSSRKSAFEIRKFWDLEPF